MIIQLIFEDPLLVSRHAKFDQLLITIKENAFLTEMMGVLPNVTMKKEIPTQGFVPQIEFIEEVVNVMGKVELVVFSSNMFVNILT